MSTTTEPLYTFLRGLRTMSGAHAVALFVPGVDGAAPGLFRDGAADGLPELGDLERALAFDERCRADGGGDLVSVASASDRGRLWRLHERVADPAAAPDARRARHAAPEPSTAWLGLAWDRADHPLLEIRDTPGLFGAVAAPDALRSWSDWMVDVGLALACQARQLAVMLSDPLTGLAGRVEFQAALESAINRSVANGGGLAVAIVHPGEFGGVNERFGHDVGDAVMREFAARLRGTVRDDDLVGRYGGASFMVLMRNVDRDGAERSADRMLQTLVAEGYQGGEVQIAANLGAAVLEASDRAVGADELLRRADQALRMAEWTDDPSVRFWDPALADQVVGTFDSLSGIFTANVSKDYRNMRVLLDTVNAVAGSSNLDQLCRRIEERLQEAFRAESVAIRQWGDDDSQAADQPAPGNDTNPASLLLGRARSTRRAQHDADGSDVDARMFAVPLVAGDTTPAALLIEGCATRLAIDENDLTFLETLGSHLALAFERARLAEVEQRWRDHERLRLQAELDELRGELDRSEIVCRSPAMNALYATVRRVAETDATVLIHGESGTGKELLSRTVHELSLRKERALVVVDCSAIPTTLIESELFGHERGAYTGAQQRKVGRLVEADGGTVILDEIGELPLEAQSKLLRFVQEKQVCAVGGNRVVRVDARVVAVTNRNLEREVEIGNFREDLFHRLNVIRLDVPPLRRRPEDIEALVEHFLQEFSLQYHKTPVRRLSDAARERVLAYEWPGNVRELKNRLLQAVILADSQIIGPDRLDLPGAGRPAPEESAREVERPPDPLRLPSVDAALRDAPPLDSYAADDVAPWERMLREFEAQVESALADVGVPFPSLGRWVIDDLVLSSFQCSGEVISRGANRLGVPEATFRRKLRKAQAQAASGAAVRREGWSLVRRALDAVVALAVVADEDLLHRARIETLGIVRRRSNARDRVGAILMGVTEPTYRRWTAELAPDSERAAVVTGGVG